MFCPFCASPEEEAQRRDGSPGNVFVKFVCGNQIEMDAFGHGAPSWLRGTGSHRPLACIAFGNAHPHNLARRIAALEAQSGS